MFVSSHLFSKSLHESLGVPPQRLYFLCLMNKRFGQKKITFYLRKVALSLAAGKSKIGGCNFSTQLCTEVVINILNPIVNTLGIWRKDFCKIKFQYLTHFVLEVKHFEKCSTIISSSFLRCTLSSENLVYLSRWI